MLGRAGRKNIYFSNASKLAHVHILRKSKSSVDEMEVFVERTTVGVAVAKTNQLVCFF